VIDTYDLSNNNCTTKSCDAAKVGGTNVFTVSETLDIPISETQVKTEEYQYQYKPVVPGALQMYLENKSSEKNSSVKEITPNK
jgi:hypothetical protein